MAGTAIVSAKLGIKGAFQCRNAAGEVIKTIEFEGSIPLDKLGMSVEEAQQLINEANNGSDNRE